MPKTEKISAGQLMLLLFLSRIMHTMIFRARGFSSGTPLMLGLFCATALEAVAAIPAVLYYSKFGGDPSAELFKSRAIWLRLLYSAYFAVIAGGTVALFTRFLSSEFSKTVSPAIAIILLCAAAAYCASRGIEGLGRAGTVVFWLFAALFVFMALVNKGGFDWLNLRPLTAGDGEKFAEYFFENLSSAWWLPMLCVLGESLNGGAAKAAYGYLALKLAVIEALLLLVTVILWKYVNVIGYPIFALGAYAKSDFIQRFDAINMLVWAINCVLAVGAYLHICAKPFKSPKIFSPIFAAISAIFAFAAYFFGLEFDSAWFLAFKSIGVAALGIAVPGAACIKAYVSGGRKK